MEAAVAAIHRAVQCVEARLQDEVEIADLAEAAGYSLFHFARTFNRLVHHSPYDYLIRRRLSEAARKLIETDERILDIALAYRFNSPEVFTRAFKRMFGVLPSEVRAQGSLDPRLLLSPCSRQRLELFASAGFTRPERLNLSPLRLAGLMTRLSADAEDQEVATRAVWESLRQHLGTAADRAASWYGVHLYPAGWERLGSYYLAGREILPGQEAPPVAVLDLPAGSCAAFTATGEVERSVLREYVYATWMPGAGFSPLGGFELECFGHEPGETQACPALEKRFLYPLRAA